MINLQKILSGFQDKTSLAGMNRKAAELPMSTIIVVVLVVIVLIAVGIFFFTQFSKGGSVVSGTSEESAKGGETLAQTIDWNVLKQGGTTAPTKGCSGTKSLVCGDFCIGATLGDSAQCGFPAKYAGISSCSNVGCTDTCAAKKCSGSGKNNNVCVGGTSNIFGYNTSCSKILTQADCQKAGCTWTA